MVLFVGAGKCEHARDIGNWNGWKDGVRFLDETELECVSNSGMSKLSQQVIDGEVY